MSPLDSETKTATLAHALALALAHALALALAHALALALAHALALVSSLRALVTLVSP